MPKYYCDYCDIYLTHDSPSVRRAHNTGWKHLLHVKDYYAELGHDQAQDVINKITNAHTNRGPAVPAYFSGPLPIVPPGMMMSRPGMPPLPPGAALPLRPPGAAPPPLPPGFNPASFPFLPPPGMPFPPPPPGMRFPAPPAAPAAQAAEKPEPKPDTDNATSAPAHSSGIKRESTSSRSPDKRSRTK